MKQIILIAVLVALFSVTAQAQWNRPSQHIVSDSILVKSTAWNDSVFVSNIAFPVLIRIQVISGNGILGVARENDTSRTQVVRCVVGEDQYLPMVGRWFRFKNLISGDSSVVYREIF